MPATLEAGSHDDRYAILEHLAHGGMSEVLSAWDRRLGRRVALKVCRDACPEPLTGCLHYSPNRLVSNFATEMQVLSQLHHPAVVPLYDFGRDARDHLFFTMPLVSRKTLHGLIFDLHDGRNEEGLTRGMVHLLNVCDALRYAHSKGVVHCDVKPSNVAIGALGETYLLDWGLARVVARPPAEPCSPGEARATSSFCLSYLRERHDGGRMASNTLVIAGTPAYMPLEQIVGGLDWSSVRSDVYAFGAMLYHLLSGSPPYTAESADPHDLMMEVLDHPPAPLEVPGLPPELVRLCRKCMSRSPVDRYPDMDVVGELLHDFIDRPVIGGAPRSRFFRRLAAWRTRVTR